MFVIYEVSTTTLVSRPSKYARMTQKDFNTLRSAKAFLTKWEKGTARACNFDSFKPDTFAISELIEFKNNIEKQVTRKNLMSGKEYKEPLNTECFMSPSCESYWSM